MVNDDCGEASVIPRTTEESSNDRLSRETVQTLYETYGLELLAFLVGVLRDATAANDVSQITFRRLVEVGHTAREATMKGWIFKVALREALVYRRQDAVRERHLKQYSLQREAEFPITAVNDDLVQSETVERLKELLTRLPADQLYVVRQRIYENKTFSAIAEELEIPLGTVLTRMKIAIEKVRKWFG